MGGEGLSVGELDAVYYADLNSDGTVGAWTTSPNSLPIALSGQRAIMVEDFVYVIGGNDGTDDVNTVYMAQIAEDGSVGEWSASSNTLPAPRRLGALFTASSYLVYAAGQNSFAVDDVYIAAVESYPTPDPSPSNHSASSNGTLADTGQNGYVIASFASTLIAFGVVLLLRRFKHG